MLSANYFGNKLFALAIVLLIVGGLNLGILSLTGKDYLSVLLGKQSLILNGVLMAIGIAALSIAFYRDSYLPFLGPTIVPCEVLKSVTPEDADFEVPIHVKPGSKVLYWAAEPSNKELDTLKDWREAYMNFRNAGIAVANEKGIAMLAVRKPQPYQVHLFKTMPPHIHYRICMNDGVLGRVETIKVDTKAYYDNWADYEVYDAVIDGSPDPVVEPNLSPEEIKPTIIEEAFYTRDGKEIVAESFEQEEAPESTQEPPVDSNNALAEIVNTVNSTAEQSMMPTSDALDVSPNAMVDNYASAEFTS